MLWNFLQILIPPVLIGSDTRLHSLWWMRKLNSLLGKCTVPLTSTAKQQICHDEWTEKTWQWWEPLDVQLNSAIGCGSIYNNTFSVVITHIVAGFYPFLVWITADQCKWMCIMKESVKRPSHNCRLMLIFFSSSRLDAVCTWWHLVCVSGMCVHENVALALFPVWPTIYWIISLFICFWLYPAILFNVDENHLN